MPQNYTMKGILQKIYWLILSSKGPKLIIKSCSRKAIPMESINLHPTTPINGQQTLMAPVASDDLPGVFLMKQQGRADTLWIKSPKFRRNSPSFPHQLVQRWLRSAYGFSVALEDDGVYFG
jgi:hypothetical protein